jgi:transcriptional regulator GlxA family with amidase domain
LIDGHKFGLQREKLQVHVDSPLTFQQRIRVEAAKRMLESGESSFDEIPYQVGYEDSSSFRKVFSKQTGLRPIEYRKKFKRV